MRTLSIYLLLILLITACDFRIYTAQEEAGDTRTVTHKFDAKGAESVETIIEMRAGLLTV